MTDATKRKAIIFLVLAALVTVLLAAALPQLELQPGVPLPRSSTQAVGIPQEEVEPQVSINAYTFLETVLGLFFLMLLVYLITRRKQRKEVLQILLKFALFSLTLTALTYLSSNAKIDLTPAAVEILPPEVALIAAGPPLAQVPAPLLWLSWIGLAGLVVLLGFLLTRLRPGIRRRAERDHLAVEAQQAAAAIEAGQDFSNIIVRCYQQMSAILKKEQGLALEETMTAREFEVLLEKRGVPNPPVRQLTRLFEVARYAAQPPGPAEETQAVACLNAIAQYSSTKKPGQRR